MSNINIPIPEELHRELKVQSAKQGIALKDLIVQFLESKVKKFKKCER